MSAMSGAPGLNPGGAGGQIAISPIEGWHVYEIPDPLSIGNSNTFKALNDLCELKLKVPTVIEGWQAYRHLTAEEKATISSRSILTAATRIKLVPQHLATRMNFVYCNKDIRFYLSKPFSDFSNTLTVKGYGVNCNIDSARTQFSSSIRSFGAMDQMLGSATSFFEWIPDGVVIDVGLHLLALTVGQRKAVQNEFYDYLTDVTIGKANSKVLEYPNDGLRAWMALVHQYQSRAADQQDVIVHYMDRNFLFEKGDPEPAMNKFIFLCSYYNSFWLSQWTDLQMREKLISIIKRSEDISDTYEVLTKMKISNSK